MTSPSSSNIYYAVLGGLDPGIRQTLLVKLLVFVNVNIYLANA